MKKLGFNEDGSGFYHVVGIDGSNTPDPEYWFSRFQLIPANSPEEAVNIYCNEGRWMRKEEYHLVKVFHVTDDSMVCPVRWAEDNLIEDLVE